MGERDRNVNWGWGAVCVALLWLLGHFGERLDCAIGIQQACSEVAAGYKAAPKAGGQP